MGRNAVGFGAVAILAVAVAATVGSRRSTESTTNDSLRPVATGYLPANARLWVPPGTGLLNALLAEGNAYPSMGWL